MADQGIFVRLVALPDHVPACVIPNDDTTFDIYINSRLTQEGQEDALEHELRHIKGDHFYNDDPVGQNEREAG